MFDVFSLFTYQLLTHENTKKRKLPDTVNWHDKYLKTPPVGYRRNACMRHNWLVMEHVQFTIVKQAIKLSSNALHCTSHFTPNISSSLHPALAEPQK